MKTHVLKITALVSALFALLVGALGMTQHSTASATDLAPTLADGGESCTNEKAAAKEKKTFFVSCGGFF